MSVNLDKDTETLARWANSLNEWTWPADLGGWPDVAIQSGIKPIIEEIRRRIGDKEILRYHHTHNLKRSDEDFEVWWSEKGQAFLNTKVALSVHFGDDGLPIAEARVIKEGDETEAR